LIKIYGDGWEGSISFKTYDKTLFTLDQTPDY